MGQPPQRRGPERDQQHPEHRDQRDPGTKCGRHGPHASTSPALPFATWRFSTTDRLQAIGYQRARLLLVFAGLGILSVVTIIMYVRRVDTVEVVATLLVRADLPRLPVLPGPGRTHRRARRIRASTWSSGCPAIDAIGFAAFAGLIMSRSFAYLVFGLLGGWSNQVLEDSLDKLELYDQIDDATGLFNARSFVQDTELEVARSARYETLFSISVVELPVGPIAALGRRRHDAILRGLGRRLAESVRSVDRVAHARDDSSRIFAAILPETSSQGGAITQPAIRRRHSRLPRRPRVSRSSARR